MLAEVQSLFERRSFYAPDGDIGILDLNLFAQHSKILKHVRARDALSILQAELMVAHQWVEGGDPCTLLLEGIVNGRFNSVLYRGFLFVHSRVLSDSLSVLSTTTASEQVTIASEQALARQVRFLREAMRLKTVKRTGWVLRGVENPESVADHSWAVALCAMLVEDDSIDWRKSTIMAQK